MKKLVLLSLALVFVASAAMAQPVMYHKVNSLGVDYIGADTPFIVAGSFSVITVVENIPADIFAFEVTQGAIPTSLAGPMFALGAPILAGAGPVDVGDVPGEYIVGMGGCVVASSLALVTTNYLASAPGALANDTVVDFGGTDPSSFGGAPGIAACDGSVIAAVPGTDGGITGALVTFPDGGVVLNATPLVIATEPASFGQVKARF